MLQSPYVVIKLISQINFVNSARPGDVLEVGVKGVKLGRSSITLKCEVTHHTIIKIEQIVFVDPDPSGLPASHGKKMADLVEEDG